MAPSTRIDSGFTLIEAVVALAIVALVVMSYLGIRTSALADGIEARNWRLAREIAEERMSEIVAGAHELPPQQGVVTELDKYPGFSFKVAVGETAVNELESELSGADVADDPDMTTRDRQEWQRNRETLRKAQARGMTALEYQDQLAADDYERRMAQKAPSEDDLEQIAVVVYFPKLDAKYEGQKESYVIKSKVSTLALSGLTPEQAHQIAESQGQTGDAANGGSGSGSNSTGGGGAGANPFDSGGRK